jgi:hypothetical protein
MERDESTTSLARRFWIALEMPGWGCAAQLGGWEKIGFWIEFCKWICGILWRGVAGCGFSVFLQ